MTALMGLQARLRMARLFVSTDSRRKFGDLEEYLEAAFSGGVDMLAVAEQGLKPSRVVACLEMARTAAFHTQGIVVVDGSVDIAEQIGADALLLSADMSPAEVKASLHHWAIIGVAATTTAEIDAVAADPNVDFFTVGAVFTPEGDDNLDLVRHAAKTAPPGDISAAPWFAAGGITVSNLEMVLDAGARRIRMSPQECAADAEPACQKVKDRLRRAWSEDPHMESYVFNVLSANGL